MKSLLREPLLHFAVIGVAMFAMHAWLARDAGDAAQPADRVVRITDSEVAWLSESWARQWQRPPREDEMRGLVTDYLKESLLAREATELGLDVNDTLIRRRLAQKMQFVVQDAARLVEPTDEELTRFYEIHRQRFQSPPRIWLEHIYFKGDDAEARAAVALDALTRSDDASPLGDRSLLPAEFAGEDQTMIAGLLGDEFARRVFELEAGRWQGPIASGYGVHLVRVSKTQPAAERDLSAVRDQVLEAWYVQQQQVADERYFVALLEKYDVVVDENIRPLLGPRYGPLVLSQGDALP